jgi:hypothetical protein
MPSAALASPKTPYNVQASMPPVVFGSRALHPATFSTTPMDVKKLTQVFSKGKRQYNHSEISF